MEAYDPITAAEEFRDAPWERPATCGGNSGNCVEVNLSRPGVIAIRDPKLADSPALLFDQSEWSAFLDAVRAGQFDG